MSGQPLDQLLASLIKGNRSAFKTVFELYEKRLYYFIHSITKSDYATEEILQEVFIKIWTKKETIVLSILLMPSFLQLQKMQLIII